MVIYELQLRRRVNQHANETVCVVGLFSLRSKAHNFVLKNGKEWPITWDYIKTGFYALVEYNVDQTEPETDTGVCVDMWDFNGKYVNPFVKVK